MPLSMQEDSTPEGLKFVAEILEPLDLIVWGTLATSLLGSHAVHSNYMLGVPDEEMDLAAQKLLAAGFTAQKWSYSSTVDPTTRSDEAYHIIQAMTQPAFANFDKKTLRFQPPDNNKGIQRTILIPKSYLRLSISNPQPSYADPVVSLSQPPFYTKDNIHLPNVALLIQSFLMVYLEEESAELPDFRVTLMAWAVGYLYRELELRDDILDSCKYSDVRKLFDKSIERDSNRPRAKREKWGKIRARITNDRIKDFQ